MRIRFSWQWGPLALLAVTTVALVWIRMARPRHAPAGTVSTTNPIADLEETKPLNQPGGGVAPAEAYKVYSALYQAPMNEPLAFAEDSWTDVPQVGASCLNPINPEERQMADAFVAANRQSHRWEQKFSIPQGYRLLSNGEASQARNCLSPAEPKNAQCASYKQLRHVRLLGMPGFNHTHTRALVSVVASCGSFCGSGGIFEVEKAGGRWQRSAPTDFTRNCSWVY